MDRGSTDGSATALEDSMQRGLERQAREGDLARPPFVEIARRGRRRQRRRREAALAGIGVASVAVAALTWRTGESPDRGTTTVSVVSIPDDDGVGLTDEEVHELGLGGWEAWATEPVPPGCEAFAATHPGARGLRKLEVGDNLYGEGREDTMYGPYSGPGAHLGEMGGELGPREIIGGDGTVLHRETDPDVLLWPEVEEAGGWVYFVRATKRVGQSWGRDNSLWRVPSSGGPAEVAPGSPPGGSIEVSPDGRWLSIMLVTLGNDDPEPTSLILVDVSSDAIHELAIDGEATGSTWSTAWTDDSELLVFARFDDFGMDCTTGQLIGPMFPGPSDAGRYAVDLDRFRAYRVDPNGTSMVGAEVAWPR